MKAEPARQRRVVVDTNIWISAALSRAGAPALLARRILDHRLPVFSPATFAELQTRLWRPKFDRYLSLEARQRILHDLNAAAYWVDIPPELAARAWCRDAEDDKFIQTALAAQAAWLVTGDRDLLDLTPVPHLRILAPAEALKLPVFWA